ncbi:MAG TPA: hypothetical protein VFD85_14790 [Gemmatimonadales bacterium]|nr:hypothetical protein [Gemmatimonadales bacterium]
MKRYHIWLAPVVALAAALGCTNDGERSVATAPRVGRIAFGGSISGRLLGPDGTSLCNFVPEGSGLIVRVFAPPPPVAFAGSQFVTCPDSTFSIPVDPGSYFVRVTLPFDPAIGALPVRYLLPTMVNVDTFDVPQDIQVEPGSGLGGGATLDGAPMSGVGVTLTYDHAQGFGASVGASGADGGWVDEVGREPMIVQNDLLYLSGPNCDAVGALLTSTPLSTPFVFPTQRNAINCAFTKAPNLAFSHSRTRVALTPMPGDIGGTDQHLAAQFGTGWGVQFPDPPQIGAHSLSQLFLGGLIVGIRPDRVLTGFDRGGYVDCTTCRDLGLDGRVTYTTSPQFGTKVNWHYSDAGSAAAVGLKVLQQSYDGIPPNDYVIVRFSFTNAGTAPLTFYPGMFTDWDVDQTPADDIGATTWNGSLMYQTDATPGGNVVGTFVTGDAPVSGNTFYRGTAEPADVVAALAGDVSTPSFSDPVDLHYLHAIGPITLKPNRSADLWVAVVAGQSQDQFLANATAAAADIARRRAPGSANTEAMSSSLETWITGPAAHPTAAPRVDPRCKRGCTR